MLLQGLVDRLIVATEEQDVLYVLHWLNEMKQQDCLEQAINNKHSWKGYSALESIIESPFSQLSKFILQMLLFQGADGQSEQIQKLAMQKENLTVLRILLTWNVSGGDAATGTAQLFECSLEQAASWIDSNLPRAPNLENLTGCGPLPPSPAEASHSALDNELLEAQVQLAESSTELVETASSLFAPEDDHEQLPSQLEEGELPSETVTFDPGENDHSFSSPSSRFSPRPSRSPSFSPISSSPPAASLIDSNLPIFPDRSAFTESEYRREMPRTSTDSSPQHALPVVRLYLGGLPFGTRVVDIENLFQNMEVKCRVDWSTRDKDLNRFCFVDIESDQVSHSIQQLDGTRLGDRVITCAVARRALPEEEHRRRSRESDYSSSRISNFVRPLDDLSNLSKRSTAPPRSPSPLNAVPAAYNLLILNLPLLETSHALDFLDKFPRCEVLQLKSRNQAVAFIGVNSEYDANYIIDHYGGRRISGEKISIVPVRKGLGAEEAVLEHFGRTDDSDVGEGSVAKKRRFD